MARRLSSHDIFSQWTLALLAVGQIVISLVAALGLQTNFRPSYVTFASVFFGVLVLAYSLLLEISNFSARVVKMHECGLQLGRLARQLVYLRDAGWHLRRKYDKYTKNYYDILDKHENHTRTDYLVAHYEYYDGKKDLEPSIDTSRLVQWSHLIKIKIYWLHFLQFAHYIASIVLIYAWIYAFVVSK